MIVGELMVVGMLEAITDDNINEEAVPEDNIPEDVTPEDAKPEDSNPEGVDPEDGNPDNSTPEDVTPKDNANDDNNVPDGTADEIVPEDATMDITLPNIVDLDNGRPDDAAPETAVTGGTVATTVIVTWELLLVVLGVTNVAVLAAEVVIEQSIEEYTKEPSLHRMVGGNVRLLFEPVGLAKALLVLATPTVEVLANVLAPLATTVVLPPETEYEVPLDPLVASAVLTATVGEKTEHSPLGPFGQRVTDPAVVKGKGTSVTGGVAQVLVGPGIQYQP